jgi:hypothetical protein
MAEKPRRLRPWRPSGLYRTDPPTRELQAAAAELRAQIIADKGGIEVISTAERISLTLVGLVVPLGPHPTLAGFHRTPPAHACATGFLAVIPLLSPSRGAPPPGGV